MAFVNSTKTPSDGTLLGRTFRRFLWCRLLFFIPCCFCDVGCCCLFCFRALYPGFSGPSRPPPALSSTLATFHCFTFPSHFHRDRYGFEWAFFFAQGFFTLPSFPTFATTCFYQGFPGSPQFFLEGCRASHWGSKHRPGPSVCFNQTAFSKKVLVGRCYLRVTTGRLMFRACFIRMCTYMRH